MTADSDRTLREYRLARHYLNKLSIADEALRRGQANVSYSLAVIDQEWEHIRHWQAWSARRTLVDKMRAQLCEDFALAGLEVLANRNNMTEQATWLQTALTAAEDLEDTEAERILCYELEMTQYRLGALEAGRQFACRLLDLGEAANDPLAISRAFFGLAVYSEERGRYMEAEEYYQRALKRVDKLGIATETGRILNSLGGVACIVGDFLGAYEYCSRYLALMEADGKMGKVCHALLSLGESLIGLKAYEDAERHLQRAVQMCQALGFRRLLGVGLLTLGSLAMEQNNLETARASLDKGLQAVRSARVPRQIAYGLARLGDIERRQGHCAESLAYLHEGVEVARSLGNPRHLCDVKHMLANTYLAMNDISAARSALGESLAIAQSLGLRQQHVRILSSAAAYFADLGEYERAANLAGVIAGDPLIDEHALAPICAQVEMALDRDAYQQALTAGSARSLDDAMLDVLSALV